VSRCAKLDGALVCRCPPYEGQEWNRLHLFRFRPKNPFVGVLTLGSGAAMHERYATGGGLIREPDMWIYDESHPVDGEVVKVLRERGGR